MFVLTDVGSDPDDQQSLVRLLTYANDLEIEGIAATTSTHLRDTTTRAMIEERLRAYAQVLPNLRVHDRRYPDAAQLMRRVYGGTLGWGMEVVGKGRDTEVSRAIIAAIDKPDPRPLWVTVWSGAKELAQALWRVREERTPAQVKIFLSRLRVYSISDQDDAGPWARVAFPELFWIASIHAYFDFNLAAWTGINAAVPGADQTLVTKPWIEKYVRPKGPLGAVYPLPQYAIEGDTPSLLYLLPNGLGSPEHPDWGSWGGRYGKLSPSLGLWTDTRDTVTGVDGRLYTDNKATVWRWRSAFQNDFAARMDWSVSPTFKGVNHPPHVRLNGSDGSAPLVIATCPNRQIELSAAGSTDPDGNTLRYRWWRYDEVTGVYPFPIRISEEEGPKTTVTVGAPAVSKRIPPKTEYQAHIILEVQDDGAPTLTRYRRAVISVPGPQAPADRLASCAGR